VDGQAYYFIAVTLQSLHAALSGAHNFMSRAVRKVTEFPLRERKRRGSGRARDGAVGVILAWPSMCRTGNRIGDEGI
jgi:hypothetical protein